MSYLLNWTEGSEHVYIESQNNMVLGNDAIKLLWIPMHASNNDVILSGWRQKAHFVHIVKYYGK